MACETLVFSLSRLCARPAAAAKTMGMKKPMACEEAVRAIWTCRRASIAHSLGAACYGSRVELCIYMQARTRELSRARSVFPTRTLHVAINIGTVMCGQWDVAWSCISAHTSWCCTAHKVG